MKTSAKHFGLAIGP